MAIKSLLILAVLCFCIAQVIAQTQPNAVRPPSAVHIASPSDPPSEASIMHLLEVTNAKRSVEMMFQGMATAGKQGARQGFLKEMPDATEEQLKIVDSIWDDIFKDLNVDDLLRVVVEVYQRHFTQGDIDALLAFYQSPIGQKFLAEQPSMMQETMKASSEYASRSMEPMMKRMEAKMKALTDSIKAPEGAKPEVAPKNTAPKKP